MLLPLSVCAVIWRMLWWTWIMVTQSPGTTWVPCCHKCVRSCSSSCSKTLTAPWASVPAASWWCCRVLLTTNALPLHFPLAHLQSYRLSHTPTPSLALPVQLTILCSVGQMILDGLWDGSCSPARDTEICFMTALCFPSSPLRYSRYSMWHSWAISPVWSFIVSNNKEIVWTALCWDKGFFCVITLAMWDSAPDFVNVTVLFRRSYDIWIYPTLNCWIHNSCNPCVMHPINLQFLKGLTFRIHHIKELYMPKRSAT